MIGQRFAHAEEETLFRAYAELHILAIVHQREEALRLARRFCLAKDGVFTRLKIIRVLS